VTATILAATAVSSPASAETMSDAWITTKVKVALLTTEGVSGTKLHVDTVDGRVTLYGTVPNAAEKTKAGQVARSIKGTSDVRNLLQVVSAPAKPAVEVSDAIIKKNVSAVLESDAALADGTIKVQSVDNGVVLLSGSADTLSDHLRALEDASRIDGVRRVASNIKSPDTLGDSEIWRDGEYDPTLAERSAASDMWTTSAVKLRLLASGETPGFGINVDTVDGEVTLFGVVDSQESKTAVATEARKVDGVKSVANELQVVAPSMQSGVADKDSVIDDAVSKRIGDNSQLSDSKINVEVKNGIARLSGSVMSQSDRLTALTVTRSTKGVRGLIDDLQLQPAKMSSR
jgi:hyperosmotically inducible protein